MEFTTTGFNKYIPGLEKVYGENQRLAIRAIPMTGGDIDVNSNGVIEMNGDVHMNLLIQRGDGDYKTYPDGWEHAADINLKN